MIATTSISLYFYPLKFYEQGNTAVYLLYAHARICSIIRKSGKDIEELKKVGLVFEVEALTMFQRLSFSINS